LRRADKQRGDKHGSHTQGLHRPTRYNSFDPLSP
jgi:hypothetical protein